MVYIALSVDENYNIKSIVVRSKGFTILDKEHNEHIVKNGSSIQHLSKNTDSTWTLTKIGPHENEDVFGKEAYIGDGVQTRRILRALNANARAFGAKKYNISK